MKTNGSTATEDLILEFREVTKEFPGVRALDKVSLKVRRGTVYGLCGENGAGKSTLMKILSGVYPADTYSGEIFYLGEEFRLNKGAIRQARDLGIAIVYQELTLVPNLSVAENIFLGAEPGKGVGIDKVKLVAAARDILDKYELKVDPTAIVKTLGVGEMQMVEIAKALAEEAKVLILDEPSSALSNKEVDALMDIVTGLKKHGVTCIYITHRLEEFFRICDEVSVLRDGRVVTTKPSKDFTIDSLVSNMVGRDMKERFPYRKKEAGRVLLEVENFTALKRSDGATPVVKNVSFSVHAGEVFGIAGLMGSGRTELVNTLFGEYGIWSSGTVKVEGKEVKFNNSREAMEAGIGLVPEDRKMQGLVLRQSILQNMSLPNLNKFSKFLYIDKVKELINTMEYFGSLQIKAPNAFTACESLSGGNQQKVVISKWLMTDPKILILDDPTRGIDVGAKYEIYKIMNSLTDRGMAVIMISSELEEVLGMSDRIMVMHEGKSVGILDKEHATQEKIMSFATGQNINGKAATNAATT